MRLKGNDFLFIALGGAAFYLIAKNEKVISSVVSNTAGVVNPLLSAASKGSAIVTNPSSYKTYTQYLLEAPFTSDQAWSLFWKQPGLATSINAIATSLGLWK